MSGIPIRDRRAERREATQAEILDAAWAMAREVGLAGISLRDLGARVGMRAQSLYSYFTSKDAIFDAMFHTANEELLRRMQVTSDGDAGDPVAALRAGARTFVEFCVEDPARYQLLFLRTIPGFEPSPRSYGVAVQVLDLARRRLAAIGATSPELVDLWTAMVSGLVQQQIANEPASDRWTRLLDDAIDMYLAFVAVRTAERASEKTPQPTPKEATRSRRGRRP